MTNRNSILNEELDEGRITMDSPTIPGPHTRGVRASRDVGRAAGGAQIVGGDEHRSNADGPGPQVMGASTLTGNDVVNSQGEDLGDIEEIMLDVESGRIAYGVLACGGFLGMGKKLVAIPWDALKLDADNKCFILDVDEETLKNAPDFDKDNWPSMADPEWASNVHTHYGFRPYWE